MNDAVPITRKTPQSTLELFAITLLEHAENESGECRYCGQLLSEWTHSDDCPTREAMNIVTAYYHHHAKEYVLFKRIENVIFRLKDAS